MKVKLVYPKMPGSKNIEQYNQECIAFEKYDGTNLHWVWEKELGWYALGTRRSRFDLDKRGIEEFNVAHPGMEEAANIFLDHFASKLEYIFTKKYASCNEIVVFTEFFGENSFAGMHKKEDAKQLILFDVEMPTGIIHPTPFINDFATVDIARVVYNGKLTGKFIQNVRKNQYDTNEGVVCKGIDKNQVWMFKIKTDNYQQKLKNELANNWENYWE